MLSADDVCVTKRTDKRRFLAARLTELVILTQAAVIVSFLIDPADKPLGGWIGRIIWGWWHKESFIPLIACLLLAPPMTWLAWSTRGRHRWPLMLSWLLFAIAAGTWYLPRIAAMIRIVLEHRLE